MGTYEDTVGILEVELGQVEQGFRGLSEAEWATPTKLRPLDESQPPWTLFELAGHFDISIGLTVMLMAEPQAGQVGRDRVSFFIFPRSEVAPVVYDYAYTMVEGKTPAQMPDVLAATFAKTVEGARSLAPETVGPGYYALMRLDEFVASRVVEAVVHGLDLTDALGREPMRHPRGGRRHRRHPRRPAGPQDGGRAAARPGRRHGLGAGGVGPGAGACRPAAAADRLMDFTEETATAAVEASFAGTADPRLREILGSLVRHLHGFVREVEPTFGEWERAVEFLAATGRMCDDQRQEFILLSDVLGVTMLVDAINHRKASEATESTVLGPFHMVESPPRELGDTIDLVATGQPCVVTGQVRSLDGPPLGGALVDVWQADDHGFYDVQQPGGQPPGNGRGLFTCDDQGRFWFRTVTPEPLPDPHRRPGRRPAHRHRSPPLPPGPHPPDRRRRTATSRSPPTSSSTAAPTWTPTPSSRSSRAWSGTSPRSTTRARRPPSASRSRSATPASTWSCNPPGNRRPTGSHILSPCGRAVGRRLEGEADRRGLGCGGVGQLPAGPAGAEAAGGAGSGREGPLRPAGRGVAAGRPLRVHGDHRAAGRRRAGRGRGAAGAARRGLLAAAGADRRDRRGRAQVRRGRAAGLLAGAGRGPGWAGVRGTAGVVPRWTGGWPRPRRRPPAAPRPCRRPWDASPRPSGCRWPCGSGSGPARWWCWTSGASGSAGSCWSPGRRCRRRPGRRAGPARPGAAGPAGPRPGRARPGAPTGPGRRRRPRTGPGSRRWSRPICPGRCWPRWSPARGVAGRAAPHHRALRQPARPGPPGRGWTRPTRSCGPSRAPCTATRAASTS